MYGTKIHKRICVNPFLCRCFKQYSIKPQVKVARDIQSPIDRPITVSLALTHLNVFMFSQNVGEFIYKNSHGFKL